MAATLCIAEVRSATSPNDAQRLVLILLLSVSGSGIVHIFRRASLQRALRLLEAVTEQILDISDEAGKDALRLAAKRCRRDVCVSLTGAAAAFPPVAWAMYFIPLPASASAGRSLHALMGLAPSIPAGLSHAFLITYIGMTIVYHYTVHTLILNVMVVTAGLLDRVARQMEEEIPTSAWLSAHRRVIQASREVERSFGADMVYLFAAVLGAPLIGSADIVINGHEADPSAYILAPVVLNVFWPLCEAGELVAAARESLAGRVYHGPWLQAAPRERRQLLLLMASASGRGGLFRCRAVGTLRRSLFIAVIRNWFQFLQMLVNIP